jgi:hypothetical protein
MSTREPVQGADGKLRNVRTATGWRRAMEASESEPYGGTIAFRPSQWRMDRRCCCSAQSSCWFRSSCWFVASTAQFNSIMRGMGTLANVVKEIKHSPLAADVEEEDAGASQANKSRRKGRDSSGAAASSGGQDMDLWCAAVRSEAGGDHP